MAISGPPESAAVRIPSVVACVWRSFRPIMLHLVDTSIEVDDDIDASDDDLCCNQNNDDPFKIFPCENRQ